MTPQIDKSAEAAPQDWATGRKQRAEVLGFGATVTLNPAQDGWPGCWAVDFDIPPSRRAAAIAIDNIEARISDELGKPSKLSWQVGDDGWDFIFDWHDDATSLEILNLDGSGERASARLWMLTRQPPQSPHPTLAARSDLEFVGGLPARTVRRPCCAS